MLNKVPLLIIILVVVFLITSLLSFITMEKVVIPEKIEVKEPETSAAGGIVKIDIKGPPEPPQTSAASGMVSIGIV